MNRNEADTRAQLIDPILKSAGWNTVRNSVIRREIICPGRIIPGGKRVNPRACDYVLIYRNKKLAVVEAKKERLSYTEGVRQAKEYAERLQCRIAYATNGHEIYQIDLKTGEEKIVDAFLPPKTLWALTFDEPQESQFTTNWRKRFAEIPLETKGGCWQPRYYQDNAIHTVLEAIAKGHDRILLTMATGTGKTSIAFQIAWKLFQSRWSLQNRRNQDAPTHRPRILFLADRNILADQAFNHFSPFDDDALIRIAPDEIKKHARVPKNGSVFFTIFQTFMSGKDKNGESTPYFGDYPQDFFDFIVIDECHRGGANDESTWRNVLDYFSPAVQLGLTATPKRKDNVDTYAYFGEPVYSYTLKQGINDGFLTPFKIYPIVGTLDDYVYTPGDGLVVQGNPDPGKLYREHDFNRVITIPEREKKRVHYWMDRINPHDKTLVFCATQKHAGLVRDLINQYTVSKDWTTNSRYCVRVTANDGIQGEADLKTFRDNEKTIPTVLTTSRKLSTGVDARNVRNIVLMRPCNNMIEFKQIIGRGTRLFDGKEFFTIFDFVKAHHNFADPQWDGEPIEVVPSGANRKNDVTIAEPKPQPYGDESIEEQKPETIKIKLSDSKTRQIKHISSVLYWGSEDQPITVREFVERLFHDLPQFFKNEQELRRIWKNPETRVKLLDQLAQAGYDQVRLNDMRCLINAEKSDIYDVLAYIAFAAPTMTRQKRADRCEHRTQPHCTSKQHQFLSFILSHYVDEGVGELALGKLPDLITLHYGTPKDAQRELDMPIEHIQRWFVDFQASLYDQQ